MKRFSSSQISLSAIAVLAVAAFTELSNFSVASYGLTAGSKTSATATLLSMPKSPMPSVAFKSSNTAVAQVPLSKLASSTGTVVIDVTGVAPGCAQITASYGGRTRTDDVVVHPTSATTAFTMKVPDQVLPFPGLSDATLTKTLTITSPDRTAAGTVTTIPTAWKLSSSNTSIVTVPDSVKALTSATFKITGKGEGCATITARLGTASVSKTVMTRYIGG